MAEPILSTLFESEQFSGSDVHKAGQCLMAYAAGLVGFMGIKVLALATSMAAFANAGFFVGQIE